MTTLYDIGDVARLTAAFTGDAGPVNPTTVTLRVKRPSGTTSTVTHTNPAVGSYQADLPIDEAGNWSYRWQSTGVGAAAEEDTFRVRNQTVT